MQNNFGKQLGEYVRGIFDLNKDGAVTFKEFLAVIIPNYAVGIALLTVDLLMIFAEYRVWDVGMKITNDPYKAFGFVLVSGVPFLLSQILWLYPHASGWQQAIALLMGGSALYTSATLGLADLSVTYDAERAVAMVIRLTVAYVVMLLVYAVIDNKIKLFRKRVQAGAKAEFEDAKHKTLEDVLDKLERALMREQELRARYGDDAVEAHMEIMAPKKRDNSKNRPPVILAQPPNNGNQPETVNPPIPPHQWQ